ncbi:AAA family ATPase [Modestobacter sp. I12A-02628]|uniref:Nuclease SbcCD subunit C n=1 Tax=Goekera deserti TaxID=2497753 RepID=A0A7K3W840_9ACTN|nr:SMC family ATPase [Goekera deserti]MPR00321.1 AAA family ATPase [Goekera deserti]NDI49495.1 AAA family ATPase [Goekera deserti]NEL52631.1 SMC family ATPase [Goekera deserti]
MRVHRLGLTAFGPFADSEEVDLDDVGRDGLFLLWGPTGAGKTTLLDAIVFALYGTVPGARGEERRLRSDHAADAVRTEVRCEVTLAGERLLITRRPEQQRPKKRGVGSTTEQARLVLQRWSADGWEPVSTRIDEGSEHLRRRLGLTAEQFCQVVLLPQGDFARFLRAEPEDRARLLRTLFDVDRFARVEEWLAEQRRAADEGLRQLRGELGTLLTRVAQTADVAVPERLAPALVGAPSAGRLGSWVTGLRAAAHAGHRAATVAAAVAAERVAELEQVHARAQDLDRRHRRRQRAQQELDALVAAEADVTAARTELDAGRRAEVVRDALQAAGRTALDAERADELLEVARGRWAAVSGGLPASADRARELRDELAGLRSLLPEVQRADRLAARVEDDRQAVAELSHRCASLTAAVASLPAEIVALQESVRAAEADAARLPGLTAAREAREAAVHAASEAEELARRAEICRRSVESAREAWLDAREQRADLLTQRWAGMAAELATRLTDGVECSVCGSPEHPRPAVHGDRAVTDAAEEAAAIRVEETEAALEVVRGELQTLSERLAARRAGAGGRSPDEHRTALRVESAAEQAAAAAGRALPAAQASLAALVATRDRTAAELAAVREELSRRAAEQEATVEALRDVTERLDASRGDAPDLGARVRELTDVADRCDELLGAEAEVVRARSMAERAREAAETRSVECGFRDVLAAAEAHRTAARLRELSGVVDRYDAALLAARAVLADPELVDLPPAPDLTVLRSACEEATTSRETAVAELDRADRCTGGLDALAGDLIALETVLDERSLAAEQVIELADLVQGRGANTRRMRLQSFVLAARLEQVAEVASRRLQDMSAGRYTFLHSDVQGRYGARGGLGLDVFDEHTGCRRPTKTLSGGESFMASLALALGLADVVTAESGGVQIDTLFVDEGFGSLDPQALDAVMTVLDDLRRGGRTVGVVSHVEELRTRIPSRLEVVTARHGSRLAG